MNETPQCPACGTKMKMVNGKLMECPEQSCDLNGLGMGEERFLAIQRALNPWRPIETSKPPSDSCQRIEVLMRPSGVTAITIVVAARLEELKDGGATHWRYHRPPIDTRSKTRIIWDNLDDSYMLFGPKSYHQFLTGGDWIQYETFDLIYRMGQEGVAKVEDLIPF